MTVATWTHRTLPAIRLQWTGRWLLEPCDCAIAWAVLLSLTTAGRSLTFGRPASLPWPHWQ
eukprot:10334501-Karenia_brevis.AAC.1